MKIQIDPKAIRRKLDELGLSLPELERITGINVNRWKYITNSGGCVTDTELKKIANIFLCDQNEFIHPDFQLMGNIPVEIDVRIRKLYEDRSGDIQPLYESIMRNYQKTGRLDNLIGEANRLLAALFTGDKLGYDIASALTIIVDDFQEDRVLSGSHAELDEKTIAIIFSIATDSLNRNSAQQALSLFLYVLVIFDVVFLEESIASVTQFTTERFGDKAEQYCQLTCSLEILRNTLIEYMVSRDLTMGDEMVYELKEEIMEGVLLMLLACYKAGQHLNGDYFSSQYVNRKELDAIIKNLTRRMANIGLKIPGTPLGLPGTRFGRHLLLLRNIFLSSKPQKRNFTPQDYYVMGYLTGKNN